MRTYTYVCEHTFRSFNLKLQQSKSWALYYNRWCKMSPIFYITDQCVTCGKQDESEEP